VMVLDLSFASIVSLLIITSLLVLYSILDCRNRRVMNEVILAGGAVGFLSVVFTGHIISNIILHMTALLLVIPLIYILYRIGSIGGADAKVLFIIALVSPGIELGYWDQPVLEAVVGLWGELLIMLLGGYLYLRLKGRDENTIPPLLPFLLFGYITIQIIALI